MTPPRGFSLACAALVVYALGLLSIGLTRDWRLLHEDNGAMHTTLALSHVELGLGRTRAHDLFFNPATGHGAVYGHHPPATALIVAAAFALTGSAEPWVARSAAIAFHLGSLVLFLRLLTRLVPPGAVFFSGLLMATVPMSAYFGRMVDYEPFCLFAVMLQLLGYATFKLDGSARGLAWLAVGAVLGGVIAWASLFFTAAITLAEFVDVLRGRSRSLAPGLVPAVAAVGVFAFDVWHLWFAGGGSLAPFLDVLSRPVGERKLTLGTFVGSQVETFRRYYSHAGLVAAVLVVVTLVLPRGRLSARIFAASNAAVLRRLLAVSGAAALGYVLAAPSWAAAHSYWQFYFLPFAVLSTLLAARSLWRTLRERPTPLVGTLLAVFVLEIIGTSAYMLYVRHTRPGAYAIKQTAKFRANFLVPASSMERRPEPWPR